MFAQLLPPPVNFYEGQSFAPDLPALKVTGVIKPPGALLTSFQFRGSCEYLRQEPPCLLIRSHRSTMFLSKGLYKLLDMFSVSGEPAFNNFALGLNEIFTFNKRFWKWLLQLSILLGHFLREPLGVVIGAQGFLRFAPQLPDEFREFSPMLFQSRRVVRDVTYGDLVPYGMTISPASCP
jgi:hypothetical protein